MRFPDDWKEWTWRPSTGVSGIVTFTTRRIWRITVSAGGVAGTVTINPSGDVINVPANSTIVVEPWGMLYALTLSFTNTTYYCVETINKTTPL